jgi:transposase
MTTISYIVYIYIYVKISKTRLVEDRDVNAAKNILRAGAPPSGTGTAGLLVELRSPRL